MDARESSCKLIRRKSKTIHVKAYMPFSRACHGSWHEQRVATSFNELSWVATFSQSRCFSIAVVVKDIYSKLCFSCTSDTQLKMYSIETRQQVRGINLSSMVGCFTDKFVFC